MSAAAPSPNNILMLAVLGIGAYWFFNRRATAAPAPAAAGTAQQKQWAGNDANLWGAVSKIIGAVTPSQTQSYYRANAANSGGSSTGTSTSGDPYNPDGIYLPSTDGVVVSPAPGIDWDSYFEQTGSDYGQYL